MASESEPFAQHYQQMLLTLEPMLHLPFDLSIDFETRQEKEAKFQVAIGNSKRWSRSAPVRFLQGEKQAHQKDLPRRYIISVRVLQPLFLSLSLSHTHTMLVPKLLWSIPMQPQVRGQPLAMSSVLFWNEWCGFTSHQTLIAAHIELTKHSLLTPPSC